VDGFGWILWWRLEIKDYTFYTGTLMHTNIRLNAYTVYVYNIHVDFNVFLYNDWR
jgi:hypothetical protein